jgi:hypothetical protein
MTFIAEAYWDMSTRSSKQGFDYCYDKRLYDRLAHEDAAAVRGHLQADLSYQQRLLRFIENHDEPRAAPTFGPRARAAAVVMSTIPGARLYHDGPVRRLPHSHPGLPGSRAPRGARARPAAPLLAARRARGLRLAAARGPRPR